MNSNEKQYYIYIRSTGEKIPVTKEQFDAYYRDINAYRIRQERHGRCVCPELRRLTCDMDCLTCSFYRAGDMRSIYHADVDNDGNEIVWIDKIADEGPLIADIIADASEIEELFKRLEELMPGAIEIGKQRMAGAPDEKIAPNFGMSRQVMSYRLNKVKAVLQKEFPEIF